MKALLLSISISFISLSLYAQDNVGIGNTNPSVAVNVNNGGDIEFDREYTYETSKIRTLYIAPNAFQSNLPHLCLFATEAYSL